MAGFRFRKADLPPKARSAFSFLPLFQFHPVHTITFSHPVIGITFS
jgi:hypothetical protein